MQISGFVSIVTSGLMLFSHWVNADERTLHLNTELFPPYNFTQNEQLKGINYEIVATACELAGIQCHFSLVHWNRAYNYALNHKNSGVFTTARYPKREALFAWAGPLVYSNACFYRLRNRPEIAVESEQDLLLYTVGIARGDIYQDVLNELGMVEGKQYLTFSHKHEDVEMFALNRLDLMVGSSLTLAFQLEKAGLLPEDVEPVLELNDDALGGNFLALNKDTDKSLLIDLQAAMDSMLANNQYAEIIAKYVTPPDISGKPAHKLQRCLNGSTNITPAQ